MPTIIASLSPSARRRERQLHALPRRLLSALCLVALVAGVACLPGAQAPNVTAKRTLGLSSGEAPSAPGSAFAVVFGAPRGEQAGAGEVSLVFNRPMRALEIAGDESASPATIVVKETGRAPAGQWRWVGTSALLFAPSPSLPAATAYVVTVPAGARALSGETLAHAFTMEFSTPRPTVESLDPGSGTDHLVPSQTFVARFNQPVDVAEVARTASLVVGGDTAQRHVALQVSRPDASNPRLVKLTPASPLPLASPVTIAFDGALRGTEGPLPMGKPVTFGMATYGPLDVVKIACWNTPRHKCGPGGGFYVEFSNDVHAADIRKHVRVSPRAAFDWPSNTSEQGLVVDDSIPVRTLPGVTYTVTTTAGLTDEHGQALQSDVTRTLAVDDLDPSVDVGISGTVIEAAPLRARVIPVTSVNTPSYRLLTGTLDERQIATVLDSSAQRGIVDRIATWPSVHSETVSGSAPINARSLHPVAIEPLVTGHGGRGAILVATPSAVHVASVTDLGLTAKMSRFGSVVWVTRLSDGKPVPGATVSVFGAEGAVAEARADDDGIAVIPEARYRAADEKGTPDSRRIVVARLGDDWTWRRVGDSMWSSGVGGIDASGGLSPLGMLFTDRGVYRPGETLKLEALFRVPEARGTSTPAGRSVTVHAVDAVGDAIYDGPVTLDAFGAATLDVPLPATAHLGGARIEASLEGAARDGEVTSVTVQLAAYKASEVKVGVEAETPGVVHGDEARFDVRGDYLFGAPMAGAKVHWTATREPAEFTPPASAGFVVDDAAYQADLPDTTPRAGTLQSGDGVLDAHGTFVARALATLAGQRETEAVVVEGEVQDVTRQTAAASARMIVHPASFYVGLKSPESWFLPREAGTRAEVTAIAPDGSRRSGVTVHVDLVRRTWSNTFETSADEGHWDSKVLDAIVGSCDVTSAGVPAPCPLAFPEAGFYVVRATAHDEKSRVATASYAVYAIGKGGASSWSARDARGVSLVTDKHAYRVGDVAQVLVKTALREADALVTVERAGFYRQERVHLSGATPTITVPITDDMRPNAFVGVHLVRGRTGAAPAAERAIGADANAPSYEAGYATLTVDPEARRLHVALTPAKKDLRPGESVDADVLVTDRAGAPVSSELTLWAVDEGVLMLTRYETPDPIPVFTAPRPLAVFSSDNRSDLARIVRPTIARVGVDKGDEGGGGGAMRADFRATAWFQPGVMTGADGKAHVHFKLPDNLTTFRLMAVAAAQDDRFGEGETSVTTSRPLMLRPALPRFLRAGDAIDAGVVVTTKGMQPTRVEVTATIEGLTVTGDVKRVVDVPAGESREVRWAMAAPRVGPAKLTFRARAGAESDAVQVTRAIESPATLETAQLDGETEGVAGEKLGDLRAIRDDMGSLEVKLASTALVGVGDGMSQLLEYPYGCTEQLTSRLVPLVAVRDLATDFGIALPKDPDALADAALEKILANQRGDGGFGWWPDSPRTDPWVTAYALWGLDAARRAGRPVPDDAIDRGAQWLRGQLQGMREPLLESSAFALDVLATIGKPDPGFIDRLYEQRAKLSLAGRASLAHAMALAKMDAREEGEMRGDLETHLRLMPATVEVVDNVNTAYAPVFDSTARTTAMVLRALVAIDPKHPLASKLARGLLGERVGGQWRSTHEAAWALLALDDYRRAVEATTPRFDARVWIADHLAFQTPFHERTAAVRETSVPMPSLLATPDATLAFQVDGSGTLFYEARLRYARKELPKEELDRGLYVKKRLRAVTPEGLAEALKTMPTQTQSRVGAGDLVLVDVLVVVPSPREQVVVDDPLPAGLEPVDATFATTGSAASVVDANGAADEDDAAQRTDDGIASGRAWGEAWYRREMHDDRVLTFVEHMPAGMYHYRYLARATTPGRFVVPPTSATCMYEPSVFGRTAASTLEVGAP